MKSPQQHNFALAPQAEIERSSFDRSHGIKTTFDIDKLIPFYCDEILPGDTFNLKSTLFARLATPINPIMDNMYLDTFYFFVPTRLVWANFKKFMGEQLSPADSTDYVVPVKNVGSPLGSQGLHDYFGLPIYSTNGMTFNELPFRCYNKIFNEWFRDQNLQTPAFTSTGDATTTTGNFIVKKRGKRHDYFTSALPWSQKGEQVSLPLGGTAYIGGLGIAVGDTDTTGPITARDSVAGHADVPSTTTYDDYFTTDTDQFLIDSDGSNVPQVYADLTAATGASINAWRQAFQIQKYMEKDARGGTRYTEKIRSHFGVTSPDSRLQRSEYLGGSSSPVTISPVTQTSETDATTPQGNLAAVGTVQSRGGFTKSFTEHGYVIGIVSARADLTYSQGINRMWTRTTALDYYWPSFAHLGEQTILNKEIYNDGSANDELVFGYQERYAEYRYKPSQISGKFRSDDPASLDSWHLSEDFSSLPALNATFIESTTPLDRCIAVPSEPHFIMDGYIKLNCTRPMPVYAPPGMIDHF